MTNDQEYPAWICADCGSRYGSFKGSGHVATFHHGSECGWCGTTSKAVTEPRDYCYPPPPHRCQGARP